jgi:hypothetical protein
MSHGTLIVTPFATAKKTAEILGVSHSRKQQLLKILESETPFKPRLYITVKTSKKNRGARKRKSRPLGVSSKTWTLRWKSSKRSHASKKARTRSKGRKSTR